jgi:hypothetical protein
MRVHRRFRNPALGWVPLVTFRAKPSGCPQDRSLLANMREAPPAEDGDLGSFSSRNAPS